MNSSLIILFAPPVHVLLRRYSISLYTHTHAGPLARTRTRTRIHTLAYTYGHKYVDLTRIYTNTRALCVHTAPSINLAIQFKDRVLRCINVVKSKREKNHLRYIIETAMTKIRDWLW